MLDRTKPASISRVATLVDKLLARRSITRLVEADDDLTASGLSSLDLVNLMLSVEAEFGIKIPERDMTPSNFRSIVRIDALVQNLLQPA